MRAHQLMRGLIRNYALKGVIDNKLLATRTDQNS